MFLKTTKTRNETDADADADASSETEKKVSDPDFSDDLVFDRFQFFHHEQKISFFRYRRKTF